MSVYTETFSYTNSYTKVRINVIDDHFELFLRAANMSDSQVEKILNSVEKQELSAFGVYLQSDDFRILEVEISVDWEKHVELVKLNGNLVDTDIGGWKKGVSPEAYIAVQRLVKVAKELKLPVRTWIRVSDKIQNSPIEHRRVCEELGYCFGSSVVPWKNQIKITNHQISGLEEANIITRVER